MFSTQVARNGVLLEVMRLKVLLHVATMGCDFGTNIAPHPSTLEFVRVSLDKGVKILWMEA